MNEILTLNDAAQYLHVNKETLRIWDRNGKLKALKTPGGHRRYAKSELDGIFHNSPINDLYKYICLSESIAEKLNLKEVIKIQELKKSISNFIQ